MLPELLAHIPVQADVMEEIVALEDAVMLDHPVVGFAHKGLENRGGNVGVVEGPEGIANVMQQGAHHILLVAAVAQRARGGLQGVGIAVHRKAAIVALQQPQMGHHPVGQTLCELCKLAADHLPVFTRAVLHAQKIRPCIHAMSFVGYGRCTVGRWQGLSCQGHDMQPLP
ncbi:hypothetical protein SDC9_188851 [bioreactor metagenome]|uniref:Uncharacterized protein n=1 Tax=bioreactor metagenome TaxID=1076179 RepID=A0A645HQH2_9ZZZZ